MHPQTVRGRWGHHIVCPGQEFQLANLHSFSGPESATATITLIADHIEGFLCSKCSIQIDLILTKTVCSKNYFYSLLL